MQGRRRSMEGWSDFLTYYDAPPTHLQGGGGGLGVGEKLNHHGGVSEVFFLDGFFCLLKEMVYTRLTDSQQQFTVHILMEC
jgi:hypothetical protein